MPSAVSTPTYQAVNANIANDGTADSPRGYAISTNADLTMTIANTRVYVTATSANRTVTLPTTSVKAGMVVEVQTACTSPYSIAINSSGANLIDTLKGTKGSIKLMALQDAPTTAAHWRMTDVYDEGTWTPTFTAAAGTPTTVTLTSADYRRINGIVNCQMRFTVSNKGTATAGLISTLPFTNNGNYFSGSCREDAATGNQGTVSKLSASTTQCVFLQYNNGTYWVDNYVLITSFAFMI